MERADDGEPKKPEDPVGVVAATVASVCPAAEPRGGDLRRRYGKMSERDAIGEDCLVVGEFVEMEGDEVKPGGVMHEGTISMESVKDAKTTQALMGLEKDGQAVVQPDHVSRDAEDLARMLGLPKGS